MRACLVYHINKSLGIFPTKVYHHLEPVLLGEDRRDQGIALLFTEGRANQSFPGWGVAAHVKAVRSTNA